MKAIFYLSTEIIPFDDASIEALEMRSGIKNSQLNIGGYLYHNDQQFIQYLEGENSAVDALYDKILDDSRHHVLHSISEEIAHRRFPNWSMHQITQLEAKTYSVESLLMNMMALMSDDATDQLNPTVFKHINGLNEGLHSRL